MLRSSATESPIDFGYSDSIVCDLQRLTSVELRLSCQSELLTMTLAAVRWRGVAGTVGWDIPRAGLLGAGTNASRRNTWIAEAMPATFVD